MQSLAENRQTVWYADYKGMVDVLDEDNNKTGEKTIEYTDPKPFLIYVAPSRGNLGWYPFGIGENYTNVMSTCDTTCPIGEHSVLWIGISPFSNGSSVADVPHNYTVERVAIGLNSILYAVKRVDVS